VVAVLTESKNPTDYLKKLRKRDAELWSYIGTHCPQVDMMTSTGKKRKTLSANTQQLLRIIQSIPSPKAEPFKQRLAQVWYERIQEIENPELAQQRMKELYELKWYPKEWIDKRLRGIAVRQELTDERKQRSIKEWIEYAILTAEISKATFGMTPREYADYKWLSKQNLRDHMNDLELIFTMLGEASTTEIMKQHNSQWFDEVSIASKKWWTIAGEAKKKLEQETGKSITSSDNFLPPDKKKLKK
jgi:hypothetical protein